MAAVAGAVADELIGCFDRPGLRRASVNNGGDIALNLAAESTVRFYFDGTTHWVTSNRNATIATAVDAMQAGAYDFLPKPFTPDELRLIVNRGHERWRLAAESARLRHEKEEAERRFVELHPELEPGLYRRFSAVAAAPTVMVIRHLRRK